MGKVYDIEKEKISEQSKKEICEACKEMAKTYLKFLKNSWSNLKRIFTLLQTTIYSEQKRIGNLKEHLYSVKDVWRDSIYLKW